MKAWVIILATLSVGASVAVSGIIGFVGLIVPHMLRSIAGSDHRTLLPNCALLWRFTVHPVRRGKQNIDSPGRITDWYCHRHIRHTRIHCTLVETKKTITPHSIMITVQNISYKVAQKNILNKLSFELQPGEVTVVLGQNGAGKSTLLEEYCLANKNQQKGRYSLDRMNSTVFLSAICS